MGVVDGIGHDEWPRQGTHLGMRVEVMFNYRLPKLGGVVVRDDRDPPHIGLIRLDDGRHVLMTECQYTPEGGFAAPSGRAGSDHAGHVMDAAERLRVLLETEQRKLVEGRHVPKHDGGGQLVAALVCAWIDHAAEEGLIPWADAEHTALAMPFDAMVDAVTANLAPIAARVLFERTKRAGELPKNHDELLAQMKELRRG